MTRSVSSPTGSQVVCVSLCQHMSIVCVLSTSGAQGEYAGLCTIRSYLEAKGEDQRKVCVDSGCVQCVLMGVSHNMPLPLQVALIPMSAHGTNPASAKMAGLNVVYLKTNKNGEVTVDAWKESIDEHKKYLACIMVTYPSTNGIFEDTIRFVGNCLERENILC